MFKAVNDQKKDQLKLEDTSSVLMVKLNQAKPKQIVETVKNEKTKQPEYAKFLSENNQEHDRQTVAARVGSFSTPGLGVENGQKDQASPQQSEPIQKKELNKFGLEKPDFTKSREQLMEKMLKQAALPNLGQKNGKQGLSGLAQSNDFVEDIPLGDFTKLNTVEYKYYGFYFRIKQKLEQFWGLSIREKSEAIIRQGRRLPASKNYVTSLVIEMDSMGKIINVQVKSSSGLRELDQAAIESFNKAGPFPNPPKGLIKNGRAVIEWGFVVKS
jgi:protein TonB